MALCNRLSIIKYLYAMLTNCDLHVASNGAITIPGSVSAHVVHVCISFPLFFLMAEQV